VVLNAVDVAAKGYGYYYYQHHEEAVTGASPKSVSAGPVGASRT